MAKLYISVAAREAGSVTELQAAVRKSARYTDLGLGMLVAGMGAPQRSPSFATQNDIFLAQKGCKGKMQM